MSSPDQNGKIFIGKGETTGDQYLALALANRHGLVAGATGEVLASFLDASATASLVDRVTIRPPSARIGPIPPEERKAVMAKSPLERKYDAPLEPKSAYAVLHNRSASDGALPPTDAPVGTAANTASPGTQIPSEIGGIGKAVVRGAFGGVMRR